MYFKKGRKSSQWVFGIHQYFIKGGRKFKTKLTYHLLVQFIKKGR